MSHETYEAHEKDWTPSGLEGSGAVHLLGEWLVAMLCPLFVSLRVFRGLECFFQVSSTLSGREAVRSIRLFDLNGFESLA